MRASPEVQLQRYLDRWIHLLGLGAWAITYEVWDVLEDDEERFLADVNMTKRRNGYKRAKLRFAREVLTTPRKIENAVVHELLHLVAHGIGDHGHRLIIRLEDKLRLVRVRASRRK